MDSTSLHALLIRQRTHLSASSSNRSAHRHCFSTRISGRHRISCQKQDPQRNFHHPERAFEALQEKFPAASEDTPAGAATALESYRRDVVPGRVFESASFDSEDAERG